MTALLRLIPPLARLTHVPEMTPVAFPYRRPPAVCEVAPMPVTFEDDFYETIREFAIPPSSVSYVMQASLWSARNSRSGFAPATVLADFADDPDEAMGSLVAAGIARRARKGGMQVIEGRGITIVNASDAEAKKAKALEAGKARSQRFRDKQKAGLGNAIRAALPAAPVTAEAVTEPASVTPTKRNSRKKPQVSVSSVTRYEVDSQRVTDQGPASDDLDQNQSSGVGQINARVREAPDPAIVTLVADLAAKKLKRIVSEAEARRAIRIWVIRAEDAGKVIHDEVRFFETCVKRERDLEMILAPPPNPLWVELGAAPEPPAGAHPYQPDPSAFVDACTKPGCGLKKINARHTNQEANTG
jgi:hypothetical protein